MKHCKSTLRWIHAVVVATLPAAGLSTAATGAQAVHEVADLRSVIDAKSELDWTFTSFGIDDGLPSLNVTSMAYGPHGLLWVGTVAGLATFDGSRFERVEIARHERPFVEDAHRGEIARVSALLLDGSGRMWVGGENGELSTYRNKDTAPLRLDSRLGEITTLALASDGGVWAGGNGLVRIVDARIDVIVDPAEYPGLRVTAIAEAPIDRDAPVASRPVWVGTNLGLFRWSPDDGLSRQHPAGRTALYFDRSGHRWEIVEDAEVRVDGEAGFDLEEPCGTVCAAIAIDDARTLVVGNRGVVVSNLDESGARMVPFALRYSIKAALPGPDGGLWHTAEPLGLRFIQLREFEHLPSTFSGNFTDVVGLDGPETVLVASTLRPDHVRTRSTPDGPGRFEREESSWPEIDASGSYVGAATATDGLRYTATSSGLFCAAPDSVWPIDTPAIRPTGIVAASDGSVWAGFEDRLVELRGGDVTSREFALPDGPLETFVARGDRLVGARRHAVLSFHTTTMESSTVVEIEGADLRGVHIDETGDVWATTYGQGLYRKRVTGELDHWTIEDGLPDPYLAWIGSVPGPTEGTHLWLNSNAGAIRVSRASLEAALGTGDAVVDCRLIPTPEANGVQGVALASGLLVLPTRRGAVGIDTHRDLGRTAQPRLSLGATLADGVLLDPSRPLRGFIDLEFGYEAVLFPTARLVTVEYRLDGHDDDWVVAGGERTARYFNLTQGEYRFQLRARTAGEPFGPILSSPAMVIRPLWHQRQGLRLLLVLAAVALTALGFWLQKRAFAGRRRVLESEVARRTIAETYLVAERAHFQSVLETAREGIFAFDGSGSILYANAAMSSIFGAYPVEIVGNNVVALGIRGLADKDELALLAGTEEPNRLWGAVETIARRVSGESFAIEVSLAADSSEEPRRYVGVVRDVSERSEMTRKLLRSEQRYRGLFQTAPTPIVAWNARRERIDWNGQAADLFSWRPRQGGAIVIDEFAADAESTDRLTAAVDSVLDSNAKASFAMQTRVGASEVRTCRWHLAPLVREDGTVSAFISIVVDMSEDLRVERDLQALRMQLARAEESERARIARELHDDFSQRLAALALNLQITRTEVAHAIDEPALESLGEVHSGIQSLATDVHALSRRLHPTVLDDLGLLVALRAECGRRAAASGIEIDFEHEGRSDQLRGEVGLALFRVGQESIQNAIKHAAPERISVRLRFGSDQLELAIQDDGCGMTPEESRGPGMGLVSMRERIHLVGGKFAISATPRSGTTVRATVPWQPDARDVTVDPEVSRKSAAMDALRSSS